MSGREKDKPFVEAIKAVRPGRRARRIMAWAVFIALTAMLTAMTVAVALRVPGLS